MIYVPAKFAAAAIIEAIDASVELISMHYRRYTNTRYA